MLAYHFCLDGKHFGGIAIIGDFPDPDFLKHKSKKFLTGYCCILMSLWHSVDGKHSIHFQSETSVFKLRCYMYTQCRSLHDQSLYTI